MRLILCKNYEDASYAAAKITASQLILKPESVLGLATGSTPLGMYKILAEMDKKGEVDFSKVITFNLDEYYPIAPTNEQSYRYFMNKNLFSHINIPIENTHILSGTTSDPQKECSEYDALIKANGGIDLQILGIGQNGHIGFNEPAPNLNPDTHLTELSESTINANSRFFENINEVPRHALTMGIKTILNAKKIILIACGENKRSAAKELICGGISTLLPASMLKLHKDVVLICDSEAYPMQ